MALAHTEGFVSAVTTEEPTQVRAPSVTERTADRGISADGVELLTRSGLRLYPDCRRVFAELFVPGEEIPGTDSRAAAVIERAMAFDESTVDRAYAQVHQSFAARHRDIEGVFAENFEAVHHRIARDVELSAHRQLFIGAAFTHEFTVEGVALTNPSMVEHPDQSGLEPGALRFLLSARAIGEGHRSCIEFRTGVIAPGGAVTVDDPSPFAEAGRPRAPKYDLALFEATLSEAGDDEVFAFLDHHLPQHFTGAELDEVLADLPPGLSTRQRTHRAVEEIRRVVACRYDVEFGEATDISERVLRPIGASERKGMEDLRLVRFTGSDGATGYRGTYTAFDGTRITPQLIETADFRTFRISQLLGPASKDKGIALFPRPVAGRQLALCRWDGEHTYVASSPDGHVWGDARPLNVPRTGWDFVQFGNCGSPVETPQGWLVLTHGVGPMRTYSLGAMLLDLDDPSRVVAILDDALLAGDGEDRGGYVPNVVYSCGPLEHDGTLVIPYGFGDLGIRFATVQTAALIGRMRELAPPEPQHPPQ